MKLKKLKLLGIDILVAALYHTAIKIMNKLNPVKTLLSKTEMIFIMLDRASIIYKSEIIPRDGKTWEECFSEVKGLKGFYRLEFVKFSDGMESSIIMDFKSIEKIYRGEK